MLIHLLGALGVVLVLGGTAHSVGVGCMYLEAGVPDANRVLIDVWVAEAQLLGGALYLAAFREARRRRPWRRLAAFGAFTIIGFGAAMLPVLFYRASVSAGIPVAIYLACSLVVLTGTTRSRMRERQSEVDHTTSHYTGRAS